MTVVVSTRLDAYNDITSTEQPIRNWRAVRQFGGDWCDDCLDRLDFYFYTQVDALAFRLAFGEHIIDGPNADLCESEIHDALVTELMDLEVA